MARFHNDDLAKLILRITCAGLLILHGSNSAINGIQHIKAVFFAGSGKYSLSGGKGKWD